MGNSVTQNGVTQREQTHAINVLSYRVLQAINVMAYRVGTSLTSRDTSIWRDTIYLVGKSMLS